jgi:hypothetical protein
MRCLTLMMAPSSFPATARRTSVSRGDVALAPVSICHMSFESGAGSPAAAAFGSSTVWPVRVESVALRKTAFLSHLYIKTNILPRQARDKHRENASSLFPPAPQLSQCLFRACLGKMVICERKGGKKGQSLHHQSVMCIIPLICLPWKKTHHHLSF